MEDGGRNGLFVSILPVIQFQRPAMTRNSDVFPVPLSPLINKFRFCMIWSDKFMTNTRDGSSGKTTVTWSMVIAGSVAKSR